MITNEHLKDIEKVFSTEVLEEIVNQYVRCRNLPSQEVCEALAHVYGKSANDIENMFETARVVG